MVASTQADQFLIYNKSTGILSYDPDGNGTQLATELAVFNSRPALDSGDFFLI